MLKVIGLLGIVSTLMTTIPAIAEVTSDGSTDTVVTPSGAVFNITGGTTVGGRNLFHSFDRFDVPTLGAANFLNDPGIVNIFSRVTGGKVSEIDGVLRSRGAANLFLMNPSGIVFGQNASLDIGGSFVATTANGIRFQNNGEFSQTSVIDSQNPLLSIDPSAFFFNRIPSEQIENRSKVNAGLYPSNPFNLSGLRVKQGRSLILLGGNLSIDGGGLVALEGHLELGAAGIGEIGLLKDNTIFRLDFPKKLAQTDITLSNQASLIVAGNQRGSIAINARNIRLADSSTIEAGIGPRLGTVGNQSGDIAIRANGELSLRGNSSIRNQVYSEATGNSGNISVQAQSMTFREASQILAGTLGRGNSGNVIIEVEGKIDLIGVILGQGTSFTSSGLFARVEPGARGNAGDITVNANQILVQDGAQISTRSRGEGRAGNLTLNAGESVELIGARPGTAIRSRLITAGFSSSERGGDITINTRNFAVKDGAIAVASTFGNGQAGNLTVNATQSVELSGAVNNNRSSLFSQTSGSGQAGNLLINTNRLTIQDGAIVSTSTSGEGQAGNLVVNAETVKLRSISLDGRFRSALAAETSGEGNAANLVIQAKRLSIEDGAVISTVTTRGGLGGNIRIIADEVELIGVASNGFRSGISSESGDIEKGRNAGNIKLESGLLSIKNGAIISSSTFGKGQGGNVEVIADTIELIGISESNQFRSAIASETLGDAAQGNAGKISINSEKFRVIDQGIVSTATSSQGYGGDLSITSRSIVLINDARIVATSLGEGKAGNIAIKVKRDINVINSQIAAESQKTEGGDINIASRYIILRGDSRIRTDLTTGQAKGGDINLTTDAIVALENGDILAFAPEGTGGNIILNTRAFLSAPLYRSMPFRLERSALEALLNNDQADINATGTISGEIVGIPNITFLQNSLTQLSQNAINTNTLLTNSCIVRNQKNGAFYIVGRGGLIPKPSELSNYSTGTIQATSSSEKRGQAIVEPQAVYPLPDGRLILSRECS